MQMQRREHTYFNTHKHTQNTHPALDEHTHTHTHTQTNTHTHSLSLSHLVENIHSHTCIYPSSKKYTGTDRHRHRHKHRHRLRLSHRHRHKNVYRERERERERVSERETKTSSNIKSSTREPLKSCDTRTHARARTHRCKRWATEVRCDGVAVKQVLQV